MKTLKIAMVAGEASGDILAAGLIRALKERHSNIEFYGIGGELMMAQGFQSKVPMEQLSVMGLVEVLSRLPSLLKLRKSLIQEFIASPPDVFIGVDAPDFNLALEGALKQAGIPTVHYVSPSVWAWKRKRIYKIKRNVDLLLSLFPFEAQHYRETQQNIVFVGHPLARIIAQEKAVHSAKQSFAPAGKRLVALLPGSRSSEVKYLAKPFLEAAQLLYRGDNQLTFVLPAANQYRYDELAAMCEQFPELPIKLVLKQSREVMRAADAILIASGTATLEATLLAKPMVVAYKMAGLTYSIYSRMIKSKYISLPNLLADEALVPEILQQAVTAENLAKAMKKALDDNQYQAHLQQRYAAIEQLLNTDADVLAAQAVTTLVTQKNS